MNRTQAKDILNVYVFLREHRNEIPNAFDTVNALENLILDSMSNEIDILVRDDGPAPKIADNTANTWLNDMFGKHDRETRNGETQDDGPKRWYDGPEEFGQPADIS